MRARRGLRDLQPAPHIWWALTLWHSKHFISIISFNPYITLGKKPTCQCRRPKRHGFNLWVRKIPWRRKWQCTPVFLPGKFHGQRSLAGCGPWGRKESDTTERLNFTHFLLYHWGRKWQPIPVFLPGESHGQRGLAGHGPWGCKGLDTTEVSKQQQQCICFNAILSNHPTLSSHWVRKSVLYVCVSFAALHVGLLIPSF